MTDLVGQWRADQAKRRYEQSEKGKGTRRDYRRSKTKHRKTTPFQGSMYTDAPLSSQTTTTKERSG